MYKYTDLTCSVDFVALPMHGITMILWTMPANILSNSSLINRYVYVAQGPVLALRDYCVQVANLTVAEIT